MLKLAMLVVLSFGLAGNVLAKEEKKVSRKVASAEIKCSAAGEGMDAEFIVAQIEKQESCQQAIDVAEACAFGSSVDSMIAGTAAKKCDKEAGKISGTDQKLKSSMISRCAKMCDPQQDGTMCISAQAFCSLNSSRFINSVNTAFR